MKQILSISLIFISFACEKQSQLSMPGKLVFGEAHGFCVGDCAHFFKLQDGKLLKDNIERYDGSEPSFHQAALSNVRYELAEKLLVNFPQYLVNHPNQTFGCPDCADQGGIHLYYNAGGEDMFWHIDTSIGGQPEEIREYVSQVTDVLEHLKQ